MDIRKVLVVDDEENFCRMLKMNLEETGKFKVMSLLSAEEIVPQANKYGPDVIIIDLLMPKIDGFEAIRMLNNDPLTRDIPVIVISALNRDIDKIKAYSAGTDDYLTKPVETNHIIATIEKVLRK